MTAQDVDRWFGIGHSTLEDDAAAGSEAVAAAVAGRDAALLLVFCSINHDHARLLDAVRGGAGHNVAIVGGTTHGQLVGATPYPGVGGVLVIAIGGPGLSVRTQVARTASQDRRQAGIEVGACLDGIDRPHRVCLVLADGLIGEQHELVRGMYSAVGANAPLVGGCTGDDLAYGRTLQFVGDEHGVEVLADAVVGIGLGSEGPIGVGIAHGWRKRGEPMLVTDSSDGFLRELDEEPAYDVYLRRSGLERLPADRIGEFPRLAFERPLGLSRRTGEDIRVIHSVNPDTGELRCLADVPQGALAWVMETDPESLIMGAKESLMQAVSDLGEAQPVGVLVFDCGARRAMLDGVGLEHEVAAMSSVLGDVPFGGFYTYGEIARTQGARGMHHLTVVSLALG